MNFRKDFFWGAASSAYQVEGAAFEDGKGPSVWDMFCRKGNTIWNAQNGDIACDHYHRYKEDVALMKKIGLKAYRFSVSWPRILPEGSGAVNPKGLDFYDRLVDVLLKAGITPFLTLFHWDYPYALYCRGGWLNPSSPDWFADYARVLADKLSDRVRHWITLNEPQCFIIAHQSGKHAPGDTLGWKETLRAGHHALLAHGKAVQAIRAAGRTKLMVGYAPVGIASLPASSRSADVRAARTATFAVSARNLWNSSWWMDPVFLGHYPENGLKAYGVNAPRPRPGDMETIAQPLDFCGINVYHSDIVRAGRKGHPELAPTPLGHALTAFRWPVTPESLYWAPKFFYERYRKPIIITENGLSCTDWVALDGRVHDPARIDYMTRYLRAMKCAIREGVDVRGYFAWSTMDNFEWAEGFKERFGLIYVDFPTQRRILKDSAYWYRDVIATQGRALKKTYRKRQK